MKTTLEILSLAGFVALGVCASVSDIRTGYIPNKVLLAALSLALPVDAVYYSVCAPGLLRDFLSNVGIVAGAVFILFCIHVWAGGDSKLAIVLSLLYPGSLYMEFYRCDCTLILAVLASFLTGYAYLLFALLRGLCRKQHRVTGKRVGEALKVFLLSYGDVLIWISAAHLVLGRIMPAELPYGELLWIALDFCLAWTVVSARILRSRPLILALLVADVLLGLWWRRFPISDNVWFYLLLFGMVILRAVVSPVTYQTIPASEVRAGMIPSVASSLAWSSSQRNDLPEISTEDLRSRITEAQAEGIRCWGKMRTGEASITIVRKIPFGVFIFAGFVVYFTVGRIKL